MNKNNKKAVWTDPIVAEVHKIREQIAAECDYDLHKIFEMIRSKERARALGVSRVEYKKKKTQPSKPVPAARVRESAPKYGAKSTAKPKKNSGKSRLAS